MPCVTTIHGLQSERSIVVHIYHDNGNRASALTRWPIALIVYRLLPAAWLYARGPRTIPFVLSCSY